MQCLHDDACQFKLGYISRSEQVVYALLSTHIALHVDHHFGVSVNVFAAPSRHMSLVRAYRIVKVRLPRLMEVDYQDGRVAARISARSWPGLDLSVRQFVRLLSIVHLPENCSYSLMASKAHSRRVL